MSKISYLILTALMLAASIKGHGAYALNSIQEDEKSLLIAAYTLNFARFVLWTPQQLPAEGGAVQICLLQRDAVGKALETLAAKNKTIAGRPFRIQYLSYAGPFDNCQVLFIAQEAQALAQTRRLLATLAELPLLTVSDIPHFIRYDGMIGFLRQGTKLKFALNQAALRQAGLHVNVELLQLATEVYHARE